MSDFRGAAQTKAQWQPLADYMTQSLGETVGIVAIPEASMTDQALERKQAQFYLVNPLVAATVNVRFGAQPIVSFNQEWGSRFAGVIAVSPASGIKTAADLKGRKVATIGPASAGGYLFQRQYLEEAGVRFSDFAELKEQAKQDDILLAVKAGLFDAGFVRTGIYEDMISKDKIKPGDVIILDAKAASPEFPFVRTTGLYPEWYVVASKEIPPETIAKVKAALLALPAESATAKALKLKGFSQAQPIGPVVDMLKRFKMPPFDK